MPKDPNLPAVPEKPKRSISVRSTPGRPRVNLTKAQYPLLRKLAQEGFSMTQIAHRLRMDFTTLKANLERDPAAKEQYDLGRANEELALVNTLKNNGNDGGAQFLLKTRHGYDDKSGVRITNNNDNRSVQIVLPGAANSDDFHALIKSMNGGQLPGRVFEQLPVETDNRPDGDFRNDMAKFIEARRAPEPGDRA